MGAGNQRRYNGATIYESFPFPEGYAPSVPTSAHASNKVADDIAAAAKALNTQRENWLNPPELSQLQAEVVAGYPARYVPIDAAKNVELKKRTLTNLYNARPPWLDNAHKALDQAVAAAYGWPADLSDDAILERLLALNTERFTTKAAA